MEQLFEELWNEIIQVGNESRKNNLIRIYEAMMEEWEEEEYLNYEDGDDDEEEDID